uniref:KN motif and ankyrin repeat domain-containing protein 1 n=1 Tax=Lygus hesperus TaxID=30085 RepID=A0A0A9WCW6_LYGHE
MQEYQLSYSHLIYRLQNEGSNSDSGSDEGTYTIHQDVGACFKGDDQSPMSGSYTRREPSKEMRGAMKVLNDALLKSHGGDIPKHVKTAVNIVQQEWFKVSSVASANPLDVEYYLDCFEEISGTLLEHVVNMSDVSGNTAMHYAVSNGNFDVVSILLDSKVCNINKLNTAGYTCIMLVALTKVKSETDREVVRRLFHMADVNIRAKQHGQTALMLAVSHGRIDTVELLLEAGADINIQDDDGSTALMCAAEHGYIEIVKLLLAQPDCDLSITDYDGTTALAIAMEAGNRDVGVLLYAQEHFSRGSSPYTSLKHKRSKSTTPTLKSSRPTTPSHSSAKKDSEIES